LTIQTKKDLCEFGRGEVHDNSFRHGSFTDVNKI